MILSKRKKYLQIALNSTIDEAIKIISKLPKSDRILIEVGTPLIKAYGKKAISEIRKIVGNDTYIVADTKCSDLAFRDVMMAYSAGANAVTCLGLAPIETINRFIEKCKELNLDSMIDMMNVENSLLVMKKLKNVPGVVILHRGVDETEISKDKQIPFYQINQIKDNFNVLVSVAGGDTLNEVQRAVLNGVDIIILWKDFYKYSDEIKEIAENFLKEIKLN